MDPRAFTTHESVVAAVAKAKEMARDRTYSDVVDGEGHQYVDLVMEGGGVLGVGLLGYTYALEECGIRFFSIGGASAGSIVALLLAGIDSKQHAKSARIAAALAAKNLWELVDGGDHAQRLVRKVVQKASTISVIAHGLGVIEPLWSELGINPGDDFCAWIDQTLAKAGVRTVRDVNARLQLNPNGLIGPEGSLAKPAQLALVTAEILSETKVVLPRMAAMFWEHWEDLPPSALVRTSMSIPYFFQPVRISPLPATQAARTAWDEEAHWDGDLPTQALFVDGGVMSNFPIDAFHQYERTPSRPTFGVKLGKAGRTPQEVTTPVQLGVATFNAARHCRDYDFITRHPDFKRLVGHIDTHDHNWIDFALSGEAQLDLFRSGVEAAVRFLAGFDWSKYKQLRTDLLAAYPAAKAS
jgi:NTE family protein